MAEATETATETTSTETTETSLSPEPSWLNTLPDDIKSNPVLARFKSVEEAARGTIEAQRKMGASVQIPGKDATPEQQAEFYKKLGRPETAEAYTIPTEGLPEGVTLDPQVLGAFKTTSHELNLSEKQVAGMYRWYLGVADQNAKAQQATSAQALQADTEKLKSEWGQAHDQNLGLAQEAVAKFGSEGFAQFLQTSGLGNNPEMIKFCHAAGKALASDTVIGRAQASFSETPAEANLKIAEKRADTEFMKMYNDPMNPGSAAARAEVDRLYNAAAAGDNALVLELD